MTINREQLKNTVPLISEKNIEKYLPMLQKYMPQYGIDTLIRIRHFIAQIAHESGSFVYYREISSGAAYDTGAKAVSLGNTPIADGDGQKYKGRGLIQITGKSNYKKCSLALFNDLRLIDHPELLELPEWGTKSACWFWSSRGLNPVADTDNIKRITRIINGGSNGLADRIQFYERAKKYII